MAKKWKSGELLEHLLEGNELSPENIGELIAQKIRENLHLDFKSGGWIADKKEGPRNLRAYVSGFANADGGVLLVGVRSDDDEDGDYPAGVDGCPADRAPVGEWARACLADLAPYLFPPARIHVVKHPAGDILIVAVARAPQLVPCREGSKIVHYLRHGDSTILIDSYLYADLVLGRRSHPVLKLQAAEFYLSRTDLEVRFVPSIIIENAGLAWVEDRGVMGWIGYTHPGQNLSAPDSLLQYVTVEGSPEDSLGHVVGMWAHPMREISPFEKYQTGVAGSAQLSMKPSAQFRWKGVVFVLPRDSVPTLLQVEAVISNSGPQNESIRPPAVSFAQLPPGVQGVISLRRV